MRVERGDGVGLARELIRLDSRNPSLVSNAPGEGAVARALSAILESWGFHADLQEAAPGRPNVVARVGTPGAHSLMRYYLRSIGTTSPTGNLTAAFTAAFPLPDGIRDAIARQIEAVLAGI